MWCNAKKHFINFEKNEHKNRERVVFTALVITIISKVSSEKKEFSKAKTLQPMFEEKIILICLFVVKLYIVITSALHTVVPSLGVNYRRRLNCYTKIIYP